MPRPAPGEITRLLEGWTQGDKTALERLTPLIYAELRRIAAGYLSRERRDHTLSATALVHEAYLRLAGHGPILTRNRAQFFAIAANLMRQILVNHAKRHRAAKRGSGNRTPLDDAAGSIQVQPDLLALDAALDKLASLDQRQSRIVELRLFAGLTEDEIADLLDVSPVTVKRDWRSARAFLRVQLGERVLTDSEASAKNS